MRRWKWLAVLAVVGVLATLPWATQAFANDPTDAQTSTSPQGDWSDMEGYCHGAEGIMGGLHMGLSDQVTLERVAGTLGLTYDALAARLDQGETIAQVAQAEGIDLSLVITTILAPHSEVLQVQVKYDYLSETQAQAILEQTRLRVEQAISVPLYGSYGPTNNPTNGYASEYRGGAWSGTGGMMGGGSMGNGTMGGGMMGGGTMGSDIMGW